MAVLNRVMLFVVDLAAVRDFYQQAMPVTSVDEPIDGFAILTLEPGSELALHAIPPNVAAEITIDKPPTVRSSCAMKPVFFVADVDDACRRFTAAGGTSQGEKIPVSFGGAFRDCVDIEGNVIQFFERG